MLKSKNITADLTLIQTKRLSTEETTQLKQQYGLTQEVINYVIDRDEVPIMSMMKTAMMNSSSFKYHMFCIKDN